MKEFCFANPGFIEDKGLLQASSSRGVKVCNRCLMRVGKTKDPYDSPIALWYCCTNSAQKIGVMSNVDLAMIASLVELKITPNV